MSSSPVVCCARTYTGKEIVWAGVIDSLIASLVNLTWGTDHSPSLKNHWCTHTRTHTPKPSQHSYLHQYWPDKGQSNKHGGQHGGHLRTLLAWALKVLFNCIPAGRPLQFASRVTMQRKKEGYQSNNKKKRRIEPILFVPRRECLQTKSLLQCEKSVVVYKFKPYSITQCGQVLFEYSTRRVLAETDNVLTDNTIKWQITAFRCLGRCRSRCGEVL